MAATTPVSALRGALLGPYAPLRREAERLIRRALRATTFGAAADELGVSRRALEKLRLEFPEVFAVPEKST